jgi:hypothetical protein
MDRFFTVNRDIMLRTLCTVHRKGFLSAEINFSTITGLSSLKKFSQ